MLDSFTMTNIPSSVPWHESENCFRRYEQIIAAACKSYPIPIAFDPAPLSVATFSARLRDAINAQAKNHWPSSLINQDAFARLVTDFKVCIFNGAVYLAPKSFKTKSEPLPTSLTPNQSTDFAFAIDYCEPDSVGLLNSTCSLLSRKKLTLPVKLTSFPEDIIIQMVGPYDVSYTREPDHFLLF